MLGQNKNYPYVEYIMWTFCEERVRDFIRECSEAVNSFVISSKYKVCVLGA